MRFDQHLTYVALDLLLQAKLEHVFMRGDKIPIVNNVDVFLTEWVAHDDTMIIREEFGKHKI